MIAEANLRDASWIIANLSDRDREEVYCQLPEGVSNVDIATQLVSLGALIAYDGEHPAALFGTSPINVCTLSVWAMGTDRMRRVIPEISRYMIETHIPERMAQGFTSMEARSHIAHKDAHRWMEGLGGVRCGFPYLFGRGGERFVTYRWTVSSYRAIRTSRWSASVPEGLEPHVL